MHVCYAAPQIVQQQQLLLGIDDRSVGGQLANDCAAQQSDSGSSGILSFAHVGWLTQAVKYCVGHVAGTGRGRLGVGTAA